LILETGETMREVFELDVYHYARGSFEETKAWLRKLIRREVVSGESVQKYTQIINELGLKLNAFIRSTEIEVAKR
jgi:four helix bundle protein